MRDMQRHSDQRGCPVVETEQTTATARSRNVRVPHPHAHGPARRPRRRGSGRGRLTLASQQRLVLAAKDGDAEARDGLIVELAPLVAALGRQYEVGVSRAELMQAGVVGLLRALERYDPSLGTPFWAYASWWVRQAIQRLVSELTRPVVLSDRAVGKLVRVRAARAGHLRDHGTEPTTRQLAADTGLAPATVQELTAAALPARALEEPLAGAETGMTLGEQLADPAADRAYEAIPRELDRRALVALLGVLSSRERQIVDARFGLDGPAVSRRELAERMGRSSERVRQIEERALDKLRRAAGDADLR
jgi:RNA polymerase primary sigma factor